MVGLFNSSIVISRYNDLTGSRRANHTFADMGWHHVAFSGNSTTVFKNVYVNGRPVAFLSGQHNGAMTNEFGRSVYYGWRYNGTLDEVRFDNNSKTAEWVWTEYNNQKPDSSMVMLSAQYPAESDTCTPPAYGNWLLNASDGCAIAGYDLPVYNWTIYGAGNVTVSNANITYSRKAFENITGIVNLILASGSKLTRST
jgi:hypothetical protein